MKISKRDALTWFRFFAQLPEGEELMPRQQELAYAVLSQIEAAAEQHFDALAAQIPGLQRFADRTLFVGPSAQFPPGCVSCLTGSGLSAVRKTNRCNLSCPFCYDYGHLTEQPPIGDGYWEIGGSRYRAQDIPLLLAIQGKPSGVAYVYLEPFCEIGVYPEIIRRFHEAGVHQHLYTNGTLCTPENLRMLGEAGLDELRFNLGASGCSERVIENLALAREFIPHVGIETPMTPAFLKSFHEKKRLILDAKPDFMNLAELHLNPNNLENYLGENLYFSRLGYLSPVWSREIALTLMREAAEEQWPVAVHCCSNRTKFARELNQAAQDGKWFGASGWGSEFASIPYAALLPVLEDPAFRFLEEEPLPAGYQPGDLVL